MATPRLSPTNPGVVYDPRYKAAMNWTQAVEKDLKAQAKKLGIGKYKAGNPKPIPKNLPHGMLPAPRLPSGNWGVFGVTHRIT